MLGGNLIDTIALPSAYTISLDFYPAATFSTYLNIVHLSGNGAVSGPGGRLPSLQTATSNRIGVSFIASGSAFTNEKVITVTGAPINQWTTVSISIDLVGLVLSVAFSGAKNQAVQSVTFPTPTYTTWPTVQVYAACPSSWLATASFKVRNFVVAGPTASPTQFPTPAPSTTQSPDRTALCAYYDTMSTAGKAQMTNWCGTGDASIVCGAAGTSSWLGVTCAVVDVENRVVKLDTYNAGVFALGGSLPTSIGGLDALTNLQLVQSGVSGSIPSALGTLTGLTFLSLGVNSLSGSILASLGGLSGLTILGLNDNEFTGPIPSSFCSLQSSIGLYVHSNPGLTCYPACLSSFATFTKDASLPTCDQQALCDFWTSIPVAANKAKLTNWCGTGDASSVCGGNGGTSSWLGVTCAVVGGVNRATMLDTYTASVTALGGSLPTSIGGLDALTRLRISGAGITGSVPSSLGTLTGLVVLLLDYNSLSSSIPSALGGLTGLTGLALGYNALTGPVPLSFCNLKSTIAMNVQGNAGLTCYPSCLSTFSGSITRDPTLAVCPSPTGQPTSQPTSQPTRLPTGQPSRQPSALPTAQPMLLPTGRPTAQPTGRPTAQPSTQPSTQPTQPTSQPTSAPSPKPTPMPSPVPTLSAPANLYRTYHSGPGCDSTPRVYDTVVLNQCSEPTQEQPFYHINSCKLFATSYSVLQRRFTTDVHSLRRKCRGSIVPTSKVIEHAKLCRRVGRADESRGYVKTHCGAMEVSPLFAREQVLLNGYATNECRGTPTRRGIVLNGCHAVHVDGSTKVQYYSHLRYDKAASEATASLVITLVESQYTTNECTGLPLLVRHLSYKKGVYTTATQKRVCAKDPLHGGFFSSATHVYGLSSFPTARPTPSPTTLPSSSPTGQPTSKPSNPTGQPTRQPTARPSRPTVQP